MESPGKESPDTFSVTNSVQDKCSITLRVLSVHACHSQKQFLMHRHHFSRSFLKLRMLTVKSSDGLISKWDYNNSVKCLSHTSWLPSLAGTSYLLPAAAAVVGVLNSMNDDLIVLTVLTSLHGKVMVKWLKHAGKNPSWLSLERGRVTEREMVVV